MLMIYIEAREDLNPKKKKGYNGKRYPLNHVNVLDRELGLWANLLDLIKMNDAMQLKLQFSYDIILCLKFYHR